LVACVVADQWACLLATEILAVLVMLPLASCPLFFQGLKPVVDIATAVHIAHQIWGLRVADDDDPPRPLESYDDCNFYMVCL